MLLHRFALPPPLSRTEAEALLEATGQFIENTLAVHQEQTLLLKLARGICSSEWIEQQKEVLKETMELNVQTIGAMFLELQRFRGQVVATNDMSTLSGKIDNIGLCSETGQYVIALLSDDEHIVLPLKQARQLSLDYNLQSSGPTGLYI